jgi:hypothetical protein
MFIFYLKITKMCGILKTGTDFKSLPPGRVTDSRENIWRAGNGFPGTMNPRKKPLWILPKVQILRLNLFREHWELNQNKGLFNN